MYEGPRKGDTNNDLSGDESHDEKIRSIKEDFEKHKKDHRELKDQLFTLVEDNKRLKDAIKTDIKKPHQLDQETERLKKQISVLSNENKNLEQLWQTSQRTVTTLEAEIARYRQQLSRPDSIFSLKQEYARRVKEMESNLKDCKLNLERETGLNTELKREKSEMDGKSRLLEQKFQEILLQKKQIIDKCMKTDAALTNARAQIQLLQKDKLQLEQQLQAANQAVKEHVAKENEAISKVHEALTLAESAISEKEACLAREKESREEVDYLARTIGQVMEEAAKKVDDDIEVLRKEHNKEVEKLEEALEKSKAALENQTRKTKIAEQKYKEMEERAKNLSKTNIMLDNDLHKASQTIIDLELKIDTLDKSVKKEQEHSRLCEERARQLQDLVESSKRMKHGWKQMTLDITSKLQGKINELSLANRKLETENCKLKKSLMGTRTSKPLMSSTTSSTDRSSNKDEES
ncbi:myosin heavy chain, cardiac muscle isoform-like [Culicoides brevitarsis]|uniref:myosin heavy chain, cardiac muscle isoform-like n=1 Tax=Culicoides brevitarsis TaxID=469753 RepID=UPI00307C2B93